MSLLYRLHFQDFGETHRSNFPRKSFKLLCTTYSRMRWPEVGSSKVVGREWVLFGNQCQRVYQILGCLWKSANVCDALK